MRRRLQCPSKHVYFHVRGYDVDKVEYAILFDVPNHLLLDFNKFAAIVHDPLYSR